MDDSFRVWFLNIPTPCHCQICVQFMLESQVETQGVLFDSQGFLQRSVRRLPGCQVDYTRATILSTAREAGYSLVH